MNIEYVSRMNLSEENLLHYTRETNLGNIVELNLSCCNLQSIKILSQMKQLRTLNLTFNELMKLDDLCFFYALESIDLSYNKISTFDGVKGLIKLHTLVATNNILKKSLDEILHIKRHCSNLLHLNLRDNPFDKVRHALIQ
jgi:Leucine-rich repeat (LRR) protein